MYQVVEHHGRLDSEFFPESIARHSWPDVAAYSQFLKNRRVDYVIIFESYDREWRTNEHDLLRELKHRSSRPCAESLVGAHTVTAKRAFDVYRIRPHCRPGGIRRAGRAPRATRALGATRPPRPRATGNASS